MLNRKTLKEWGRTVRDILEDMFPDKQTYDGRLAKTSDSIYKNRTKHLKNSANRCDCKDKNKSKRKCTTCKCKGLAVDFTGLD
jgi:hypothetical protein